MPLTTEEAAAIKRHADDFMAAVRGIPQHHVNAAMRQIVRGIDWTGTPKARIAEHWADAKVRGSRAVYPHLARVDFRHMARMARARHLKDPGWMDYK